MSLQDLIFDDGKTIADIAAYLDGLSHEERLAEVLGCGRKAQKALWTKAGAAPPITVEHFVPAGTAPLTEVVHHGRNTLPAFTRFQKRFAVQTSDATEAVGYNEAATRLLIGPGFFVAQPTAADAAWAERGAIVVNYFRVPEGEVVDGWPKVVPNSRGLQFFVYNGTRDFMRRVSSHVSIGAAYKGERPINAWFLLCRQDPS